MAGTKIPKRIRALGDIFLITLLIISDVIAKSVLLFLGRLEMYHHIRNKMMYYNNIASSAQYLMSSKDVKRLGGIEQLIFSALKVVLSKYHMLCVSIVDETPKKAFFVQLESINLRDVVRFITISKGQQFIEDEHQKQFESLGDLPLWRVVVAERRLESPVLSTAETTFEVAFIFHHAMGDGLSGRAFHVDFLSAINDLKSGEAEGKNSLDNVIQVPDLQLLPSLEDSAYWPLSLWFIGSELFKAFVLGDNDPKRWTGPLISFTKDDPPKTRLLTHMLSSSEATKVSRLCHQMQTTMTPLLTLLIARQISKAHPDYSRFIASVAISLRRFTGVNSNQIVNHVSGVTVHCSTKKDSGYVSCNYIDWDVVRSCKVVIDRAAISPANQITTMLKYLSDIRDFLAKKVGQKRDCSFEVSNLGLVDGGLHEDVIARFQQLIFSQSANVIGPPYVFSVASVRDGNMAIALTWQEGMVEEDKARQIMDGLGEDLHLLTLEADLLPEFTKQ